MRALRTSLGGILAIFLLGEVGFGQMSPSLEAEKFDVSKPTLPIGFQTIDLNLGETTGVKLPNKTKATVRLVDVKETRDAIRLAVRHAEVVVEVDGKSIQLVSGNYRLPTPLEKVQIDCPVTRGYTMNASKGIAGSNPWGLRKDARLRLFAANEPLLKPGTFTYPTDLRWFSSGTQMANEPVHVDGGEMPFNKNIYYHYGLDIGGTENLATVFAATDGIVLSAGKEKLPNIENKMVHPRYDVVYLQDGRGWAYRYSHLAQIAPGIKPGTMVRMGQVIGKLGKEGGSGGWSHLHFDISGKQPSGEWGIIEGYAFLWEAYHAKYKPTIQAVARPHHFAVTGETITLDASRSWTRAGKIRHYDWSFLDGTKAEGMKTTRTYTKPGVYSEILKITNDSGESDYDFAVVNVLDQTELSKLPPSIHAAYFPTFGVRPGTPVKFYVRTFRTTDGEETWDFGDGSPKVKVLSDGNVVPLAKDGYAITSHTYANAGHYVARVQRTNRLGYTATAHVHVRVAGEK